MNLIRCLVTEVADWGFPIPRSRVQTQAIIEAAIAVQENSVRVNPEIMVPLVGFSKELELQVEAIHETAKKVFAAKGKKVKYLVGTMIEIPRATAVMNQIINSSILQLWNK